ncbi:unnamed protein product [Rotaria socialis]|uniref:RING-type domain-containing protein n=2 Tax=Rotaria socialis TaxID=392032 RepID=A0A820FFY6_9BILA|nr:unnamed protein product [Rotaria socialis]
MNRFADVDYENKRLPSVYGYWDHPIWPFEKTMEPIKCQINRLDRFTKVAKQDCHFPSEHGLTRDESAAVYLYTMEWGDNSLYRVLNRALRSDDRDAVKPWFPFLRLFESALEKLPSENEMITWWGISSCSSTVSVIKKFLGANSTLFLIESVNGKNICGYTNYPNENEVVLGPGTRLRVENNALDHDGGLHVVHLREMTDDAEIDMTSTLGDLQLTEHSVQKSRLGESSKEFQCTIHQGELKDPMVLPCTHKFCLHCLGICIRQNAAGEVICPTCDSVHKVPIEWKKVWRYQAMNTVSQCFEPKQSVQIKRAINFVEDSYYRFGNSPQRIKINSVQEVENTRLRAKFERCKITLSDAHVVTLLHGTKAQFAAGIASEGFLIPTSFNRNPDNDAEGELKFGKAVYFAHGKKATEYGKNILVLTDCLLGKVQETNKSELKLTPEIVHKRGYHTIHYENMMEGPVNQEWAIFRKEQCLPVFIIDYEFIDANDVIESALVEQIKGMNYFSPDYVLLEQALFGTDNQCKAVLKFVGDLGHTSPRHSTMIIRALLSRTESIRMNSLLNHQNETIRILFLRALWLSGRDDAQLQSFLYQYIGPNALIESLISGYNDVSWRACGVLANMAAFIPGIRPVLTTKHAIARFKALLIEGVSFQDRLSILTVVNLMANIGCTEYVAMNKEKDIQEYLNETLMDHPDEEIQEAANRFFCNLIGKGIGTPDWQRAGYQVVALAPDLD